MTRERTESICAWVALVAIVLGAFAGNTRYLHTRSGLLPYDLNSPILAMEVLKDCKDLPLVVGTLGGADDDREQMRRLTHWDYGFIASYFVLFLFVGLFLVKGGYRLWGFALMVLGTAAATFDLLENHAILGMLGTCSSTPRIWSLVKWGLIFPAIGITTRAFLDPSVSLVRRGIGWVAAAFCVLAAVFGLAGVILRAEPFIETGANVMGLALLVGWFYFATRRILAKGLLPLLNQLAQTRLVGWLTNWPSDES